MSPEQFTKFFESNSPFSNWYIASFTIDDITFNCTEQHMMYGKAMLFGDKETAADILKEKVPREQKKLGRLVKNFNKKIWEENCKQIVYEGNKGKFTQNPKLLKRLMDTSGTTLVEASPFDNIWGIKLSADDPRSNHRSTWQGTNWLGEVLTKLRDDLENAIDQL